ncbi:MAG: Asp-tRNA(Asn)/Glu-tRNA(Gln) amidotransferase subunit GatC [Opitutales bacterium]|nr:Asp-tRNA(Asn)/Glu-tRNA(Gln) amidotransferase subunit GatC [Opitutales bacterium]
MSESSNIDLNHVSALARIELSDAEKQKFAGDFQTILGFFEKLNTVDVSALEPCAHAFPVYNVLRDDVPAGTLPVEALLKNAPAAREDQIVVPRVVDDES